MTDTQEIIIDEPMTLHDLLERLPKSVPTDKIIVEYAGCGSHSIALSWKDTDDSATQ